MTVSSLHHFRIGGVLFGGPLLMAENSDLLRPHGGGIIKP
jgi:hypothetical protein